MSTHLKAGDVPVVDRHERYRRIMFTRADNRDVVNLPSIRFEHTVWAYADIFGALVYGTGYVRYNGLIEKF